MVCAAEFGEITVDNLGTLNPNLAGNIVALAFSALIHAAFSFAKGQEYDFVSMGQIEMLDPDDHRGLAEEDFTDEFLDAAAAWIKKWGWAFTILMVIVWPALSAPAMRFTKDYWAFWVFVSLVWSSVATFSIIALPIYESWDSIAGVFLKMMGNKRDEDPEIEKVLGMVAPSAHASPVCRKVCWK